MSSNAVRVGGWAAILSIVIWILLLATSPNLDFENVTASQMALLVVSTAATIVAFYGLFHLFHDHAPLNQYMLALLAVGAILTLIPTDSNWTYNVGSILWGGAILIAGYLFQASSNSKWLVWLSYLGGVVFALLGIAGLVGSQALSDAMNVASIVPVFVWTGWIGWVMLKSHKGSVAPAH